MPSHLRYASTSPSVPEDRRPLTRMRAALAEARDAGVSFEDAWQAALLGALRDLTAVEQNSWRLVLEETEPAWRRAYAGERVWKLNGAID